MASSPSWLNRLAATAGYYVPVRVRRGIAAGARWTAYPHSAYWRAGGAEPEFEAAVTAHACQPGKVCWDFGAHYGIYTVGIARAVGPTGEVVSVEPDPQSYRRLTRHIRLNGLDATVRAINAGASDHTGTETLHLSQGAGATTSHFYYEDEQRDSSHRTIQVPVVALDELVGRQEIRLPSFIKVDVEGHGTKALRGCRSSLQASSPVILMSFHGGAEAAGVRALLTPLGYEPFGLDGRPAEWPLGDSTDTLILRNPDR